MKPATWGKYDNATYLKGIQQENKEILRSIYDEFQPNIIKYALQMGTSEEEAKDIFAGALLVIFQKVKAGNLELTSPFSAYLFAICKNLLLKYFRSQKKTVQVTESEERVYRDDNPLPDEQLEKVMLHKAIQKLFRKLARDCQRIIQMRWDGESYEAIRKALGHKSEGYTRKRKHFCHQHLTELIKKDSRVRELYF